MLSPTQSKSKLESLKFRQNVHPERRRWANKTLSEFDQVERSYLIAQAHRAKVADNVSKETEKLKALQNQYDQAVEQLSLAQVVIDADYLPEGAQPIDRIKSRNKLVTKKQQAADALALQKRQTADCLKQLEAADRKLFEADRSVNRFAETLRDALALSEEIKTSDEMKARHLLFIDQQTTYRQQRTLEEKILHQEKREEERVAKQKVFDAQATTFQRQAKERLKATASDLLQTAQQRRQREREWGITVNLQDEPTPEQLEIELTRLGLPKRIVSDLSKSASGLSIRSAVDELHRGKTLAMADLNDELDEFTRRLEEREATLNNAGQTQTDDSDGEEDVNSDFSKTFTVLQREREQQGYSKPFSFYTFGEGPPDLLFEDIIDKLKKSSKVPPTRSKTMSEEFSDFEELRDAAGRKQLTATLSETQAMAERRKTMKKKTNEFKISQFRLPAVDVQWDASFYPDRELANKLYRTPCRDPSGVVINGVSRDEAKGAVPWAPPEADRPLPPAHSNLCKYPFQQQLMDYLTARVTQLEQYYAQLPHATLDQREKKARAGADLNEIRIVRDRVHRNLGQTPVAP